MAIVNLILTAFQQHKSQRHTLECNTFGFVKFNEYLFDIYFYIWIGKPNAPSAASATVSPNVG